MKKTKWVMVATDIFWMSNIYI